MKNKIIKKVFRKHIKRPIQCLELWKDSKWTIKVYCITQPENNVDRNFISIAKQIASQEIIKVNEKDEHYYSAFLTIHIAEQFNQIIFDWWAKENELRHKVFKAEAGTPTKFTDITHTGEAFCIWELKVIAFERDAWMKHIIMKDDKPSFEEYYCTTLNTFE